MGAFQSNDVWMESKVSAADLTTKQWHFVKLNAEGRVVPWRKGLWGFTKQTYKWWGCSGSQGARWL